MLRQTPEYGSPDLNRTSRMSPTFAASGFFRLKSLVREDVGSKVVSWEAVRAAMALGHLARADGGGG